MQFVVVGGVGGVFGVVEVEDCTRYGIIFRILVSIICRRCCDYHID